MIRSFQGKALERLFATGDGRRSKTEIAKLLGVSRQTLYDVLAEKQPVTPGMALRLGKLCGNGPDLWLNLQKRYDPAPRAAGTWRDDQENSDASSRLRDRCRSR